MNTKTYFFVILLIGLIGIIYFLVQKSGPLNLTLGVSQKTDSTQTETFPLQIEQLRKKDYPGSEFKIEQTLEGGNGYNQYIASYLSEGLKINGLLLVPTGPKPESGFPAIIFNHGYIAPEVYQTTQRYVAYQDYFARHGYVVFKSDYRGNADSEGNPEGAYYSPAYMTDVLNALASVKKMPEVNKDKLGMWGHSMGGNITLRSLVVSPDIKAAVIWAGVVGSYDDLVHHWTRRAPFTPSPRQLTLRNSFRQQLFERFGSPSASPNPFWRSIDPSYHLDLVTTPVQLHTGLEDGEVPWQFSQGLNDRLKKEGKTVELYTYEGGDHNISEPNFSLAIQRSLEFFDKYLK